MKKAITFLSLLLPGMLLMAQVDEVTLVASGEGATKDEATIKALRSAIEQAFGVFVSANTEILNDELVRDEIVAVSTGNVKKYTELGNIVKPNGQTEVTLSATVSIKKITSYAISHGSSAELAGATFAANMKLRALNRKNSEEAIDHLFRTIHEMGDDIWDCKLDVGNIKSNGEVEVTLYYYANEKAKELYNIIRETLISLSISKEEAEMMKKAGEKYYKYDDYGFHRGRGTGPLTFYCKVTDKEHDKLIEKKSAKYKSMAQKLYNISSLPFPWRDKEDIRFYTPYLLKCGDWDVSRYYTKGKIFEIYDNLGNKYNLTIEDFDFKKELFFLQKASKYVNLSYIKDSDGNIDQQKLYIGMKMPEIIKFTEDDRGPIIELKEVFSGDIDKNRVPGGLLRICGTITIPIDRLEKIANLYVK